MFGGVRFQSVLEDILIDDYSKFLSLDKVTMYAILRAYGFPIPSIRATFGGPRPGGTTVLRTAVQLKDWLRSSENVPVYIKPSLGSYGRANKLITAVDGDMVVHGSGAREQLSTFCESLGDAHGLGWILQEPLTAHENIKQLTGTDKISGVRVHTFLKQGSSVVLRAIFKLNAGHSEADNFAYGRSGNMLGAIDIADGTVRRTIAGSGLAQIRNVPHPQTGHEIIGFEIPYWSDVVRLVREAHHAFPGFICPGWDIAICNSGPKILEINTFGDVNLSQHATRTGFVDKAFVALLREQGLDDLLDARPRPAQRSPVNHRIGARKHHWRW
jgi:hypothetical protein